MLQNSVWKSLGLWIGFGAQSRPAPASREAETGRAIPPELGEFAYDPAFVQELLSLSPDERQQRIQVRRQYERFARRQRLVEVEAQADQRRYR